jgi:hypothetical protein
VRVLDFYKVEFLGVGNLEIAMTEFLGLEQKQQQQM